MDEIHPRFRSPLFLHNTVGIENILTNERGLKWPENKR